MQRLFVDLKITRIGGYNAVYQSGDVLFSAVGEAEIFRRLRRV